MRCCISVDGPGSVGNAGRVGGASSLVVQAA